MISAAISTALVAMALWAGYAVVRTAIELREELRVPVRHDSHATTLPQSRSRYGRQIRRPRRRGLRRVA